MTTGVLVPQDDRIKINILPLRLKLVKGTTPLIKESKVIWCRRFKRKRVKMCKRRRHTVVDEESLWFECKSYAMIYKGRSGTFTLNVGEWEGPSSGVTTETRVGEGVTGTNGPDQLTEKRFWDRPQIIKLRTTVPRSYTRTIENWFDTVMTKYQRTWG